MQVVGGGGRVKIECLQLASVLAKRAPSTMGEPESRGAEPRAAESRGAESREPGARVTCCSHRVFILMMMINDD